MERLVSSRSGVSRAREIRRGSRVRSRGGSDRRTTRHAFTLGVAHWAAFTLRLRKGDWAKARSLIEHEIAVLRALGEASEALNRLREGDQRASAGWPATTSPSRRRCAARWGWRADWSRPRRNGA